MSDDGISTASTLERVSSGVSGLDAILLGGFLRAGVYMVLAKPGSGKTILGNQIAFRHVASGGRALYVTLLAESHARMLAAIQPMAFFDASAVGASLIYLSGYEALEKEKLKGLLDLLRKMIRDREATLLVLDGLVTVGSLAESEIETKKFVHELQVFVELVGCTTVLLTGATEVAEQYPLRTMVDGLIELRTQSIGMETVRAIEVTKFRGAATLLGRHLFEITDAGITIYPRIESRRGKTLAESEPALAPSAALGIKGLDAMLGGGLRSGSITMLLGAPGSGKTLLGLSLLAAGAMTRERGLYFGFFEAQGALCRKADAIGIGLTGHVKSGLVEIVRRSPRSTIADALAEEVLGAVRGRGMRRVFIDGLGGFKEALACPERTTRFFGALCDELRSLGVVTVLSDETRSLGEIPQHGLAAMLDNVICMQHVELGAKVHKLVSVVKMRDGAGDSSLRAFSIDRRGFVVSSDSSSAEAVLGEVSRESPRPRSPRRAAKKIAKRRRRSAPR